VEESFFSLAILGTQPHDLGFQLSDVIPQRRNGFSHSFRYQLANFTFGKRPCHAP